MPVNYCGGVSSYSVQTCISGNSLSQKDPRDNAKPYKMSSSGYTDHKKSLLVFNQTGQNQGVGGVGGPGTKVGSTIKKYSTKHGSYERYLLRKKGMVLRQQYDISCNSC